MRKLVELCTRRPVGVFILVTLAVILGSISSGFLKLSLYPDIDIPMFIVSTTYSGAGPEEIETLITKPLEEAVSAVANVKTVSSTSRHSSSMVIIECNYGTDMDYQNLKIRERIDLIKSNLPDDAEDPIIYKLDPSMMPIVVYGIGSDKGLAEATTIADEKLSPQFERIDGVASVSLYGSLSREIQVFLSADKLAYYNISPTYVSGKISSENINMPGGTVNEGMKKLTIRTVGEFASVEEFKKLKITLPNGSIVPLQELGEIVDGYEERDQITRINGKESLMLTVNKESDANTVQVARAVRKTAEQLRKKYGREATLESLMDQSEFIEDSLQSVFESGLTGGILAVLILFFFLRSFRSTFIIGISIPISIIIAISCMYFSNLSLNLVSMGGLALGLGMLVDNAIVVLESIFRYHESGQSALDSAINGTSEVGLAIIASTITTVIVFLPIMFVEDISAQIFKELAMVVTFSLAASLLVALTVIPTLSSKLMKLKSNRKSSSFSSDDINKLGKVGLFYQKVLHMAINHRALTVLIAIVVFVMAIVPFLIGGIRMEFMPNMGEKQFEVAYELPLSTNLETSNKVASEIERRLSKLEDTDIIYTVVGSSGFSMSGGSASEKGTVTVVLKDDSKQDMDELCDKVRKMLQDIPGINTLTVDKSSQGMSSSGSPIEVNLEGPDLDTLQNLSDKIEALMEKIAEKESAAFEKGQKKKVTYPIEIEPDWENGQPEIQLTMNRDRAGAYGITATTIANTVYTAFNGSAATTIRLNGEEYDILVRLKEEDRQNLANLEKLYVQNSGGGVVPLKELVSFNHEKGPTKITRENQARVVSLGAKLGGNGKDLGGLSRRIKREIDEKIVFPSGYSYTMGGEVENMEESNSSLLLVFILAVVLVYMVIAIQYENLIHPLTIMFTLPLSAFGVTWTLFLTNQPLNISSMIGVILLAGIAVNNGIVLVDYINTLRSRGMSCREAILTAGPVRLRPVAMTTLTTVLGMVPMALSGDDGGLLSKSLAVVIIGGLSFCTVLTLIVIPVLYSLLNDMQKWFRNRIMHHIVTDEYHR